MGEVKTGEKTKVDAYSYLNKVIENLAGTNERKEIGNSENLKIEYQKGDYPKRQEVKWDLE